MPKLSFSDSPAATAAKSNDYVNQVVINKNTEELNAMHIENVVRTELGRSGSSSFAGIKLNSVYPIGYGIKTTYTNGIRRDNIQYKTLNALTPPHDETYYLKTPSFNIYEDFNVKK